MYTEQVQTSLAWIQALTLWIGQFSLRQGGTPKHTRLLGNMLSGIDDGQSCQGCQMHLKISRAQACCLLGGDTVDFRRAWFLSSGVCRRPPVSDLTGHRAHQNNMKDARAVALVFGKIMRMVLSSLAAFGFLFYSPYLISFQERLYNIEVKDGLPGRFPGFERWL